MFTRYVYEEAGVEVDPSGYPAGPSRFELVRKDARTARRHIRQLFGPIKLKLIEREVLPEDYVLHEVGKG